MADARSNVPSSCWARNSSAKLRRREQGNSSENSEVDEINEAADRLARDGAVAAVVFEDGADVPEGGRRPRRRRDRRRCLWPARSAIAVAIDRTDRDAGAPIRLHPAAQGGFGRRASGPAGAAPVAGAVKEAGAGHRRRLRPIRSWRTKPYPDEFVPSRSFQSPI